MTIVTTLSNQRKIVCPLAFRNDKNPWSRRFLRTSDVRLGTRRPPAWNAFPTGRTEKLLLVPVETTLSRNTYYRQTASRSKGRRPTFSLFTASQKAPVRRRQLASSARQRSVGVYGDELECARQASGQEEVALATMGDSRTVPVDDARCFS